jgi:hypothetical protein
MQHICCCQQYKKVRVHFFKLIAGLLILFIYSVQYNLFSFNLLHEAQSHDRKKNLYTNIYDYW